MNKQSLFFFVCYISCSFFYASQIENNQRGFTFLGKHLLISKDVKSKDIRIFRHLHTFESKHYKISSPTDEFKHIIYLLNYIATDRNIDRFFFRTRQELGYRSFLSREEVVEKKDFSDLEFLIHTKICLGQTISVYIQEESSSLAY